jgi:hypothetical protein
MELARTRHGTYAGFAQLSHQGIARCALVITQQLSWDAAVQRATVRAGHFVRQWTPQRSQSPDVSGSTVPGEA